MRGGGHALNSCGRVRSITYPAATRTVWLTPDPQCFPSLRVGRVMRVTTMNPSLNMGFPPVCGELTDLLSWSRSHDRSRGRFWWIAYQLRMVRDSEMLASSTCR